MIQRHAGSVARPRAAHRVLSAAVFCLWGLAGPATAQSPADDHASHHPSAAPASGPAAPAPVGPAAAQPPPGGSTIPAANPMQMMQSMMQGMGAMHGVPSRELYPTLMNLPEISPDVRAAIQKEAERRLRSGTAGVAQGVDGFSTAAAAQDFAAMSAAVARMHEAAADLENAVAAQRALADGGTPSSIARDWFKRNLNIASVPAELHPSGILGLSWTHFSAMAALVMAAAGMSWLYLRRMRRALALLGGLAQTSPSSSAPDAVAVREAMNAAPGVGAATVPIMAAPVASGRWSGRLKVAAIFRETPTVKTFRLANPAGGDVPFVHLPGQFVTLDISVAGKALKRTYTIASAPTQRGYIELTIKREDQGTVSKHLHDDLKAGDELSVSGPSGVFTFTGAEADSIVLIAGGVGITPLMSVVRFLTDCAWPGEIFLLFACRNLDEFIFADEIRHLQRRHPKLQVLACLTQVEGTPWAGPRGRLTRSQIAETVPEIVRRRIHLCGPPAMMEAVKAILSELEVPPQQLKTEAFGPAVSPAIRVPAVATAIADARQKPTKTATVTFSRSGKSAPLPPDATILEVADHLGVWIDNSCRSGTCGTCKVKLMSGRVTMATRDALSEEEERQGLILACQAKSLGDVAVEA